ncbi:inner nuclear membrane protein Man1-like [Antedon mediterranea]|uniref:inner nuclear membrane protein Man1-like n=1 Tax=Antedon mediterranea TaxID=105859 RepID=UPI003AF4D8DF
MADTELTDAELRAELKRLGFDPGPVTASTRGLYIRKLNTLKSGKKIVAKKGKNKPVANRPLIGFSSDESDEEEGKSSWRKGRSRPSVTATQVVNDNGVGSLRKRGSQRNIKDFIHEDEADSSVKSLDVRPSLGVLKDKLTTRNRRSLGNHQAASPSSTPTRRSGRRSLQVVGTLLSNTNRHNKNHATNSKDDDFSDSDIDEMKAVNGEGESDDIVSTSSSILSQTFMKSSPMRNSNKPDKSEISRARPSSSTLIATSRKSISQNDSSTSTPMKVGTPNKTRSSSDISQHGSHNKSNNTSASSDYVSVYENRTPRSLRRRSTKERGANHVSETANHVASGGGDHHKHSGQLEAEFQTEENITKTWASKYGHYVSMMLLVFMFLFFVTLTVVYLSMGSDTESPTVLQICANKDRLCGLKGNHIVTMVEILYKALGNVAGDYYCGSGTGEFSLQSNMSLPEARKFLKTEISKTLKEDQSVFDTLQHFEDMLKSLIEHPEWGLRSYDSNGPVNHVTKTFMMEEVKWLKSSHPIMPLKCRVSRSISYVFVRLFFLGSVVFIVWGVYIFIKRRQVREEEELGQMYQLVDRIIEFLQINGDKCQAIPHVRDRLIPPSERKLRQRVWDRAVRYINSEESRVRVETQSIVGEVFSTWRWLQPQTTVSFTPTTETDMKSGKIKVWQGQAFENLDTAVKTAPGIYTQFLKIRNMFDQSLESNTNDWQVEIEDAILDKVGDGVKVLHIAVDKNSPEGCVYSKIETPVQASYAYRALQGSWFDGRLVTVKYLKPDRYYYRFPSARDMVTPLVPSTCKKKSLSSMDFARPTIEST